MGQVTARARIAQADWIHTISMARQSERQWVITESPTAFTFMVSLDQADVECIGKSKPYTREGTQIVGSDVQNRHQVKSIHRLRRYLFFGSARGI
jgi:hypothetical protein